MDVTLIDPILVKVSEGKLLLPQNLKAERRPGDESAFVLSWQNDAHSNKARLSDEILAMSYGNGKFSKIIPTGLKRCDLKGSFTLPAQPMNASHLFLFMASENGKDTRKVKEW